MLTLAAAGQPPTTTELRRIQLVRMARDIGGRPADVAGEKFVEGSESLSKAVELKDIGWALAGIAVDAVGMRSTVRLTQYLRLACAGFKVPLTGAPGMATPPSARP